MADNNLGDVMESMFKGMDYFFGSKTVVGDAIKVTEGTYVLPLVNVSFGVGAGANLRTDGGKGKNLGGGGMGAKMNPSAVLLVQDGRARIINVQEQDKLLNFVESLPDTVKNVVSALKKTPKVDKAVEEAFDKMDI